MNTTNLLRPAQVEDTKNEVSRIEAMLDDPKAQVEDRPLAHKQLQNMKKVLHEQVPTAFSEQEIDAAAKQEEKLRTDMVEDGMPTQAEMRKCPPGAVEKLRNWEARNKSKLAVWKHIRQRLHAGSTDPDVANFEKFRPAGGARELNMDNALIEGTKYMLPPEGADPVVVMSDEERDVLRELDPEVADMMAMATNKQRGAIRDFVRGVMTEKAEEKAKPKRVLSQEHKDKMAAGRAKAAAERKAAKAAATAE